MGSFHSVADHRAGRIDRLAWARPLQKPSPPHVPHRVCPLLGSQDGSGSQHAVGRRGEAVRKLRFIPMSSPASSRVTPATPSRCSVAMASPPGRRWIPESRRWRVAMRRIPLWSATRRSEASARSICGSEWFCIRLPITSIAVAGRSCSCYPPSRVHSSKRGATCGRNRWQTSVSTGQMETSTP